MAVQENNSASHLEGLMQAGQDMVRQFERALAPAEGAKPGLGWPMPVEFTRAAELQMRYLEQMGALWRTAMLGGEAPVAQPAKGDNRFRDKAWQSEPYYDTIKQSYLIGSKFLHDLVEEAQVDDRTKMQLRFYAKQYTDAISPSNFPATNPEVIRTAIETRAESLTSGMQNLIEDLQKGRITMTDEAAFEIGRNIVVTPGSVIFENELIQVIQYAPTTETVEKRPLLLVPPCINKFYVLDLTPDNSFVRWAVEQGHRVFLISWRNADAEIERFTWDDYLERGVIKALDVVCDATGERSVNMLGFCVGGTLLGCTAAVLAGRGDDRIASVTLLTTMLDFSDTGEIGIMVDETYVATREAAIGQGGLLPGKELAFVFSTLRANDLIWNYVVNNYLKGATPDAFDLLYWNSDAVNLPGPMYCWYTRNCYLENALKVRGKTVQAGVPVDLSKIKAPLYVLAAREDHIVPWRTAYATSALVGGGVRYVLAASGHIAGVINPPARGKRSHWINDEIEADPEEWLKGATEHPGSWWPDWDLWLKSHSAGTIDAPKELGGGGHVPIEPAPGRYVRVRTD
jgi:polyhydroxyalkanoate synthase